ncbi:MAG: hypothetical protein V3T70_10080, partial [Phycisphaerae bacterium]
MPRSTQLGVVCEAYGPEASVTGGAMSGQSAWRCALALAAFAQAALAETPSAPNDADAEDAPTAAVDGSTGSAASAVAAMTGAVLINQANRVEMHVSDVPISEVLRMLGAQSRRNIVASSGVTGNVTANLYDVTFEQALDAVLKMNRLGYREHDGIVFVHTEEELADLRLAEVEFVTRVFRLKYLNAFDAQVLIGPLLSSNGKVAVTPPAEAGIKSSGSGSDEGRSRSAIGNSLSGGDALVVTDEVDRVQRIAALLEELD